VDEYVGDDDDGRDGDQRRRVLRGSLVRNDDDGGSYERDERHD
jgi:hypothetical protein